MKSYLLLFLAILFSCSLNGQTISKFCDHEISPTYAEDVTSAFTNLNLQGNAGQTSVPLVLTFVMKTDSTSSYYDGLEKNILDSLNAHFIPVGIHFYLAEPSQFIYEDGLYEYEIGTFQELLYISTNSKRVNVIVTNGITLANGAGICGIAQNIPSTVFSRYSCIPSGTISHEIGHEYGLTHTHHKEWGTELADGSNCTTAGDLICDTPADPNRSDLVNNDCMWEGLYEDQNGYDIELVDANGDPYATDVSNLMSYYGAKGCRNDFTPMQGLLMQKRIQTELLVYAYEAQKMKFDIYDQEDLCAVGYSVSARVIEEDDTAEYEWDFNGDDIIDATGDDVQHIYEAYGEYTIHLIKTYPNGSQFHLSKICVISYLNETIAAPFIDTYEEVLERKYVNLIEETVYKWGLGKKIAQFDGRRVAGDQIHTSENSIMEYKIDVTAISQGVLEFEYACDEETAVGGDSLLVELVSCGDEPIILFEKWGADLGTDDSFETVIVPLPTIEDDQVVIRFTSKGDAEGWHYLYLDNLTLYESDVTSTSTSLEDLLAIYPNPTSSSFTVETELDILETHVIDKSGSIIYTFTTHNDFDISYLPSGIYFIKVMTENKSFVKRLVKI